MHLKAKTPYALLLVGCHFHDGPMRFPSEDPEFPGLLIAIDDGLTVNEHLIIGAQKVLGPELTGKQIEIHQEFDAPVGLKSGHCATLYLATVSAEHKLGSKDWSTMPDLIRGMPKNRGRLAYLRAWQVLGGALEDNVKAFEIDEIAKNLRTD